MSWASLRAAFPALSPAQLHRLLTQYQLASAMGPMSAWEPGAQDGAAAFKSGEACPGGCELGHRPWAPGRPVPGGAGRDPRGGRRPGAGAPLGPRGPGSGTAPCCPSGPCAALGHQAGAGCPHWAARRGTVPSTPAVCTCSCTWDRPTHVHVLFVSRPSPSRREQSVTDGQCRVGYRQKGLRPRLPLITRAWILHGPPLYGITSKACEGALSGGGEPRSWCGGQHTGGPCP